MSTASQELRITTSSPSPTKVGPSPVLSALADALAGALGSVSFMTYVRIFFNRHWNISKGGRICQPLSEAFYSIFTWCRRRNSLPTAMVTEHFNNF